MKVGVIGAGRWGRNLVNTLNGLGALGGVAETDPSLRAKAGETGVPVFETATQLMENGAEAVAIATPAPTHFEVAREALVRGRDVFVEKPMTLSLREAEELVQLAETEGRILMVGHLLIYQPAVNWLREQILAGTIGHLLSIHQERLGLGTARAHENSLWSLGVHDIAVALYLVGAAPHTVKAEGQAALNPAIEDDVYLHLGFDGGVQTHLHTSWLWPERRRRTTVVGTEAMLVYDELAQNITLHRKGIQPDLTNRDEGETVVFEGAAKPLELEMEHFLECIRTRQTPRSDGRSGADVVRVLEAADRGMRTGGRHAAV